MSTPHDDTTLAGITAHLSALNKALGHHRGHPRVALDAATSDQLPLLLELREWEAAYAARLALDSAVSRSKTVREAQAGNRLGELFYSDYTWNPWENTADTTGDATSQA